MMLTDTSRTTLLQSLVSAPGEAGEIMRLLSAFDWDFNGVPVIVSRNHLHAALSQYLRGQLNENDIEFWSNCIEGRDDLDFVPSDRARLAEVIYELANPELTHTLDYTRAADLLTRLDSK